LKPCLSDSKRRLKNLHAAFRVEAGTFGLPRRGFGLRSPGFSIRRSDFWIRRDDVRPEGPKFGLEEGFLKLKLRVSDLKLPD
jgi:hypothetical protein